MPAADLQIQLMRSATTGEYKEIRTTQRRAAMIEPADELPIPIDLHGIRSLDPEQGWPVCIHARLEVTCTSTWPRAATEMDCAASGTESACLVLASSKTEVVTALERRLDHDAMIFVEAEQLTRSKGTRRTPLGNASRIAGNRRARFAGSLRKNNEKIRDIHLCSRGQARKRCCKWFPDVLDKMGRALEELLEVREGNARDRSVFDSRGGIALAFRSGADRGYEGVTRTRQLRMSFEYNAVREMRARALGVQAERPDRCLSGLLEIPFVTKEFRPSQALPNFRIVRLRHARGAKLLERSCFFRGRLRTPRTPPKCECTKRGEEHLLGHGIHWTCTSIFGWLRRSTSSSHARKRGYSAGEIESRANESCISMRTSPPTSRV